MQNMQEGSEAPLEIKARKIELVEIEKLIPSPKNNNKHGDEQLERLEKIIKYNGFRDPLIVSNRSGFIICGHARLEVAKRLKMEKLPVVYQDFNSEAEEYQFLTAHNEIARWSDLDLESVHKELENFEIDVDLLGIQDFKIPEIEVIGECDEDSVPELKEDPITKRGDVWLLGEHRVMCGDSTMIDDVEKLMNGEKADMVFTDPPYNIDYICTLPKKEHFNKIKNDKMSDDDFTQFIKDSISWGCDTYYICCSWKYVHLFSKAMDESGKPVKACIVWNKVNPAQNLDKYYKAHELILYNGKFGGEKTLRSDIWECKRERNTVHPTMKPVALIEIAMNDNPKALIVSDSFLGSGSTLIACEKTNRKCYGMELDEHYCDVIINRWQNFTGKQALLESNNQKYNQLKNK